MTSSSADVDDRTHLANLKPLIESKQVVTGGMSPLFPFLSLQIRLISTKGPMFHDAHPTEGKPANFKGSMMIFRAATEAEVRETLSNDVYGKGNVWDLENMQIIPVSLLNPSLSVVEKKVDADLCRLLLLFRYYDHHVYWSALSRSCHIERGRNITLYYMLKHCKSLSNIYNSSPMMLMLMPTLTLRYQMYS